MKVRQDEGHTRRLIGKVSASSSHMTFAEFCEATRGLFDDLGNVVPVCPLLEAEEETLAHALSETVMECECNMKLLRSELAAAEARVMLLRTQIIEGQVLVKCQLTLLSRYVLSIEHTQWDDACDCGQSLESSALIY